MKIRISMRAVLVAVLLLAFSVAGFAQTRTPVVNVKYTLGAVTRTTTGDFWSTAQSAPNFTSAILHVVPGGTAIATGCRLQVLTGPTAAGATLLADDPNAIVDCTTASKTVVVR